MKVRELFERLAGDKKPQSDPGSDIPTRRNCPHEAEVLNYLESHLSGHARRRMENHFASCDDCRQLLAFFARVPDEQLSAIDLTVSQFTEDEVKEQAARVSGYIERDSARLRNRAERAKGGFYLSYPVLAAAVMVFCAISIGTVFLLTRGPSPKDSAMRMLSQAVKDGRRTPARISGNLPHSVYSATRGAGETDDIQLESALATLKSAVRESAARDDRQALARVYLAFNQTEHTRQALDILEQLAAGGDQSPELLNDIGVAWFQLGKYVKAIDSFTKALEKSPEYNEALFNRAVAEESDHRYDDAENDWKRFISVAPDDDWKAEAKRALNLLQSTTR